MSQWESKCVDLGTHRWLVDMGDIREETGRQSVCGNSDLVRLLSCKDGKTRALRGHDSPKSECSERQIRDLNPGLLVPGRVFRPLRGC